MRGLNGRSLSLSSIQVTGNDSIELLGAATVFDDVRCPASSALGAGGSPTYAKFRDNGAGSIGVFAWNFRDPGAEDDLAFDVQWPHGILPGTVAAPSIVHPHVHWSPNDANAGNVGWGLEWTEANIGEAFPITQLAVPVAASSTSTQYAHLLTEWADISKNNRSLSGMLKARVYRTNAGAIDTYAGLVWVHEFDIHYEMSRMGSRTEFNY